MEYGQLGPTERNLSRITFGCAAMGGYDYGMVSDEESVQAVRSALDLGINTFDTAGVYGFGHAEKVLGKGLGSHRNEVFISTKGGLVWDEATGKVSRNCRPDNIVRDLESSLRRLRVETIPLFQVHWPDPNTAIEETIEALVACQRAGKIQHIGLSNAGSDLVTRAQSVGRVESLQMPYNLLHREIETDATACCQKFNMALLVHSPLARGFLSGKYEIGHRFEGTDTRNLCSYFSDTEREEKLGVLEALKEVAVRLRKTPSQIAIRWILNNPQVTCVVVGVKTVAQLDELVGSMGWHLSAEDFKVLSDWSSPFIACQENIQQ